MDHLGDLVADHVGAQQRAGLGVEHRLDESLGGPGCDGLAVHAEGEAADLDLASALLGLGLGQTDRGDLGFGICAAGDRRCQVRGLQPGDVLHTMGPLVRRLVRQPGRAGDVADGVEASNTGRAVSIDHHMGAVDLHAQRLQAQPLDIADDAHSDDGDLSLQIFGFAADFQFDRDTGLGLGELVHLGAHAELQTASLEGLLGRGRDLGVFDRDDAVEHFNDRNFRAQGSVETGEFDTDGA